jgi:hypothetical protein
MVWESQMRHKLTPNEERRDAMSRRIDQLPSASRHLKGENEEPPTSSKFMKSEDRLMICLEIKAGLATVLEYLHSNRTAEAEDLAADIRMLAHTLVQELNTDCIRKRSA